MLSSNLDAEATMESICRLTWDCVTYPQLEHNSLRKWEMLTAETSAAEDEKEQQWAVNLL